MTTTKAKPGPAHGTDSASAAPPSPAHWPKWAALLTAVAAVPLALFVLLPSRSVHSAPVQGVEIVNVYPHDPRAFCQGLVYHAGHLYEGTGRNGESSVRKVDVETGEVLQRVDLDRRIFGEGIAVRGDSLYQLTWEQHRAYRYDLATLQYRQTYRYAGEGWGLTHDGRHLIMSDGTPTLRFLDPDTFRVVRRLTVRDGLRRITHLNELEYVRGEILANIWYKDHIARISPEDGRILGWIDCRSLWPARQRPDREHVLNGIAYDAENDRLFVTGKYWPKLFEIRVVEGE